MTKKEFETYYNPITIDNCKRYLKLLLDTYFVMIHKTHEPLVDSVQRHDAQILLQMFFTKGLAVHRLLEGLPYEHDGVRLNPIVDHTSLFMLARNLCEYYVAYELIHVLPDTNDKRTIMYNLFLSSGYKFRVRLFSKEMQVNNREQFEKETRIVDDAKRQITLTIYYQHLCPKEQEKLTNAIEKKNFQLYLENESVRLLSWQDAINMVVKPNGIFNSIYNYFSLNTHPSVIAMTQFEQAYDKEEPEFVGLCTTAVRYVISFMSMYLQEYIKVFPKAQELFEGQSEEMKMLLKVFDYRITG